MLDMSVTKKNSRGLVEGKMIIHYYSLSYFQGTHNTRMLQMYSEIDVRARALGYAMKVFAKVK